MKLTLKLKIEGNVVLYYDPNHPDYVAALDFFRKNINPSGNSEQLAAYIVAGTMENGSVDGVAKVTLSERPGMGPEHTVTTTPLNPYDRGTIPAGAFVLTYPQVRVYKPLP